MATWWRTTSSLPSTSPRTGPAVTRSSRVGIRRAFPVSGELRLEGPRITTLVTSLAALAEGAPTTEFAVIGGLAVLARLEGAHRVTDDLDTVATQHGDEPTAVEAVVAADGVDGLLGGTKICLLYTSDAADDLTRVDL